MLPIGLAVLAAGTAPAASPAAEANYFGYAHRAVEAWQCLVNAQRGRVEVDVDALFRTGYRAGSDFLDAYRLGRVTIEWEQMPKAWWTVFDRPASDDFVLGQLFQQVKVSRAAAFDREGKGRTGEMVWFEAAFLEAGCERFLADSRG
ncbi:MAG: hypothetical protein P8008_00885 [Gammaproteobacteria bacterium]